MRGSGCIENLGTPDEHYIVGERFEHQRAALAPVGMGVDRRVEAAFDLAEAVFREDLERHPENGWSLHGLERSLRAQNHLTEADQVHANFVRAWSRADFKLPE